MKILHTKANILNIRCDSKDNAKDQCGCIPITVSSKRNGWVMRHKNNVKDILGISNAY